MVGVLWLTNGGKYAPEVFLASQLGPPPTLISFQYPSTAVYLLFSTPDHNDQNYQIVLVDACVVLMAVVSPAPAR